MPGRAWELAAARDLLPGITLEELDRVARTSGNGRGRVIALSGPVDARLPAESEIRTLVAVAAAAPVEPWQDSAAGLPRTARVLIEHPPVPGKVVTTTRDATGDATVWVLANGVRDARILSMALQIRLREVLREDLGGVCGVRVSARLVREPVQRRELTIGFGCDPENIDKLRTAAIAEVRAVARTGVGSDQLAKLTEQLRREREANLKNNRWWVATLRDAYYFHDDLAKLLDLDAVIARVTSANLRSTAARFFDENNLVIGVLRPASAPDTAVPAAAPSPGGPSPAGTPAPKSAPAPGANRPPGPPSAPREDRAISR
jgi:hypothetical protein